MSVSFRVIFTIDMQPVHGGIRNLVLSHHSQHVTARPLRPVLQRIVTLVLCVLQKYSYLLTFSDGEVDKSSKRQRKKLRKMSLERTAPDDNSDDEQMDAELRQQIENINVAVSLPDKAVCVQIHTGM